MEVKHLFILKRFIDARKNGNGIFLYQYCFCPHINGLFLCESIVFFTYILESGY